MHAAVHGWSFPMSRLERDMRLLAERTFNYWRGKDQQPFDLGWPYAAAELVTQEEREALTEQLIRRSALADR